MTLRFWPAALVWLILALCAWAMLWPTLQATHGPAFATDFHKFLLAIERFESDAGLYAPPGSGEAAALLHGNLNPPPFSLLVLPFASLGFSNGLALWQWLSLGGALATVPLLWLIAGPPAGWRGYLFAFASGLATVAGYPALVVYNIGQVTFILLPVLALALLAILRGRAMVGGCLLGLLCALKPLFGLPVLLLLLRREWHVVGAAIAGAALLVVAATAVFGLDAWFDYIAVLGSVDWHGVSWNASLLGLASRLGGIGVMAYVVLAASAVILLTLLLALARRAPDRDAGTRLVLAGALPLLLLLSPLGWMYYWAWCVPAAALLAPPLRTAGRGGFAWWLLLPSLGALRIAPLLPFPEAAGEDAAAILGWSFYLLLAAAQFVLVLAAGRSLARAGRNQMVTSV